MSLNDTRGFPYETIFVNDVFYMITTNIDVSYGLTNGAVSKLVHIEYNDNGELVFYNLVKIKSIYTKLKNKDDKLEQSNLVYKIPCECEKCYIGETKQKLKKRLEQHRNDSKPKNAQKTNTTALAEHHFKTGHNFKFDETKILDKEDN
ncbi:hypothetical protein M0804_013359 [Polistes exclamans]|nr:hypothetical protein M0804_013359 [Polistes exclamans]